MAVSGCELISFIQDALDDAIDDAIKSSINSRYENMSQNYIANTLTNFVSLSGETMKSTCYNSLRTR